MKKVIIIGGGASGMMCGSLLDPVHTDVLLFEKNEKLGKKLFITGKGRGNLTNTADVEGILDSIMSNRRFMYSSLYGFDNNETIKYFNSLGLKTKVERGGRVFPESDHAYEITDCLAKRLRQNKVEIRLNTAVKEILIKDGSVNGVVTDKGKTYHCDAVVVASGGLSYPSTGSTGDGYRFAESAGHKIKPACPSLVPFLADKRICTPLMGVSLKNISFKLTDKAGKTVFEDFGELMFTHQGLSGPVVLTASASLSENCRIDELTAHIDLKNALSFEQLDERLIREFKENTNRQFKNSVGSLFPKKMVQLMVELGGIEPEKPCNLIKREERQEFARLIKDLKIRLKDRGSYNEAVITKGGIEVKEIEPSTMESKLVHGLYFTGEVLDVDALTGGYNLQIAWSTAAAAARALSDTVD